MLCVFIHWHINCFSIYAKLYLGEILILRIKRREKKAFSVNTNACALSALQNLNKTTAELDQVQTRINTGLKVSSAKDNAAVYSIAQKLRADLARESANLQSLQVKQKLGVQALSIANSAP